MVHSLNKTTRTLLAVFAHPDDETYRAGGTLALLARSGVQVQVLCATRGEAGIAGLSSQQAGQVRTAELRCACRALGLSEPRFLDYRDGTLAGADEGRALRQIERIVRELRPQVLLTWPPDGVSGHPDHIAVSRWTDEVFRRACDPLTSPEGPSKERSRHRMTALYHVVVPHSVAQRTEMAHLHTVPNDAVTCSIDVSAAWEQKMSAIRCHRSQIDHAPILNMSRERQRLFLSTEHFRLAAGPPARVTRTSDDILKRWSRKAHE